MRIHLTSVFVGDQEKAERFYVDVLHKEALAADGIPVAAFAVDDVHAEFTRLTGLGVRFTQEPLEMDAVTTAVFDDTCGNLVQLQQLK